MKKTDWLILIILLLSPVIVNCILLCPSFGYKVSGTQDGWLSFYGALVGSLITMFVLYRTRRWNKDDNDKTRKMQSKVLQYQAKHVWFENLRKQLDDNYRILDFQDAITAIKIIKLKKFKSTFANSGPNQLRAPGLNRYSFRR